MKNKNRLFLGGLLTVLTFSMSSCHRGIGCPSNFSLDVDVVAIVTSVISALPFF